MIIVSGHVKHVIAVLKPTIVPFLRRSLHGRLRQISLLLFDDTYDDTNNEGTVSGSFDEGKFTSAWGIGRTVSAADLIESGIRECPICYETLGMPISMTSSNPQQTKQDMSLSEKDSKTGNGFHASSSAANDLIVGTDDESCSSNEGGAAGRHHGESRRPVQLSPCQHIFCEDCACEWLEKECTCPLCRATVSNSLDRGIAEETLRELRSCDGSTSSYPYIW